jgi:hypothetical protein
MFTLDRADAPSDVAGLTDSFRPFVHGVVEELRDHAT